MLQMIRDSFTAFGRGSACDYVRRVYCKFKSGAGIQGYSRVGVVPSSIAAAQQVFLHISKFLFKLLVFVWKGCGCGGVPVPAISCVSVRVLLMYVLMCALYVYMFACVICMYSRILYMLSCLYVQAISLFISVVKYSNS